MPGMPRPKGKAMKIAYSILGKPLSANVKKDTHRREIDKRLIFEETTRVR